MDVHRHKRLSVTEVTEIFERYLSRKVVMDHVLALLKIHQRRFLCYGNAIERPRPVYPGLPTKGSGNRLDATAETKIVSELQKEAALIADPPNPVQTYNYS